MSDEIEVTVRVPVDELRAVQGFVAADPESAKPGSFGSYHASAHARFRAACRDTPIPRPIQVGDRVRVAGFSTSHPGFVVLDIRHPQALLRNVETSSWMPLPLGDLIRVEDDL